MSDAPDLILTASNGTVLVVEATTGTLRSDKVANLVLRTNRIKAALTQIKLFPKILPVLCTSLPHDDIKSDFASTQSQGIFVIASEYLGQLLLRTSLLPDSNVIAAEFQTTLESWTASQQATPTATIN